MHHNLHIRKREALGMHDHFQNFGRFALTVGLAVVLSSAIGLPRASGAEAVKVPASTTRGAAPPASGGDAADQNPLLVKQAEVLESLDGLLKKRETLLASMRKVEGEQREAVTLQTRDVDTDIRRLLAGLPDLVEKLGQGGVDATALSQRARNLLQAESRVLRESVEVLEVDLAALQKDQESLDATGLVARKDRIAKQSANLDRLLVDLSDNAETAKRLGIDVSDDRRYLGKLIERRASTMAGAIKLAVDQLGSLGDQLDKAPAADKEKVQAQIAAARAEKDGATASLTSIVALMKRQGLDDTAYSELLIRTTGQISSETLSIDVVKSFFAHQVADAGVWLRERGPTIALRILLVLAILLGFRLLAGLVRRGVRQALRKSQLGASQLMQRFAAGAAGALVMLVGVFVVLWQFNIELGHLLAGLGIAGFVVGFALQDVLANFASGIMILIYRPYDVGDWIEVPEAVGKVQHMNLVSTTILTGDNQKLLVPNKKIWGSIIRNVTSEDTRRVDLSFGIGYSDDISKAEAVFKEILDADGRVLDAPAPLIRLTELGESSVNFTVRAWCRTEDYWELRWHVTRRVKERFDEEGISIPFPQRDVHLYRTNAPAVADQA